MCWGMISCKGVGSITFCNGYMNSEQYVNIVKNHAEPTLRTWFRRETSSRLPSYFMQDGAPCHTSRFSMNFLNQQKGRVLPWPGNSPDTNPIENFWWVLKKEVRKELDRVRVKSNLTELEILKKVITDVWYNNKKVQKTAINCCLSMPNRIKFLRQRKCLWTKYLLSYFIPNPFLSYVPKFLKT